MFNIIRPSIFLFNPLLPELPFFTEKQLSFVLLFTYILWYHIPSVIPEKAVFPRFFPGEQETKTILTGGITV